MCGIAGYWSPQAPTIDPLPAMTGLLALRGPDADGAWSDGTVALGHRRLAVIDVAGSAQPMHSADRRYVIVYNGELYNFVALRDELAALGRVFATRGDTEVLLHAYAQWGTAMLARLQGMFAFAIWDRDERSLFVARDHLGVKPLHYAWDGRRFVFASQVKAVVAHPDVSRELDLDAIGLYLECHFIPAPRTIYRDVRKLEPAHAMLLADGALRTWRYWLPDYADKLVVDDTQALAMLDERLRESVRAMLVADVPLGCFLSGGIDSSLVSALATDVGGRPIDTFHLGFGGGYAGSEHEQARTVAAHIGAWHHVLMVSPGQLPERFDRFATVFDEPFGDPSALPTMMLAERARRDVTVVLTGEGADEMFCGYRNYLSRALVERWAGALGDAPAWPALLRWMPARWNQQRMIKTITVALSVSHKRRHVTIPRVFDRLMLPTLCSDALWRAQTTQLADFAQRFYDECNSVHYLDRLMYIDSRLWLPDDLLTKIDRATMAHSLEARVPYLDHRFVEFAARLDPALKQRGTTSKYLLKRLAERYLPHEIVHRRKQGFVPPLVDWIAGGLGDRVRHALSAGGLAGRGLFRDGALAALLAEPRDGASSHAGRLWALLMLETWFEHNAPSFRLD